MLIEGVEEATPHDAATRSPMATVRMHEWMLVVAIGRTKMMCQ